MAEGAIPKALKAFSIGTELAFSVIAGALLGYFVGKSLGDRWFGPGIIIGTLLGFGGGTYRIYQMCCRME